MVNPPTGPLPTESPASVPTSPAPAAPVPGAPAARPWWPRLIATDLDGTLVGQDYQISRRNAESLQAATAAGAVVVLVTGRPVRWLPAVYTQLTESYLAICANGAVIYNPHDDVVRDTCALAPPVLEAVCTRLRATVPGIVFAAEVDSGRQLLHEAAWPLRWDSGDPDVRQVTLTELLATPAVKLLARAGERDPDEFTALITRVVGDLVMVTHSSTGGLAEMSRSGVTKATGLAQIARELGIAAADVLAFGDMPNDVPMLRWAGRSVAVGNAHPAARAAADHITATNLDDGVATYLGHLLAGAALA